MYLTIVASTLRVIFEIVADIMLAVQLCCSSQSSLVDRRDQFAVSNFLLPVLPSSWR